MNAAEHYEKSLELALAAESVLERATPHSYADAQAQASALAAIAQTHATLAVACTLATALEPLARANLSRRN